MTKALIVLSGGLDSTVCLASAVRKYSAQNVSAVSYYYGQKHKTELKAAEQVAEFFDIDWTGFSLPDMIFAGLDSSLTTEAQMPQASYKEIEDSGVGVSPTYVPFRNANLLSMSTAYGMVIGADEIWAGMHAEDAHNWAYPDCTPEFLGAMANAIYVGSYHKMRLITPLMNMTKSEVVRLGLEVNAPFEFTLSCYEGTSPACGTCPTCVGRVKAFIDNYAVDPISYAIDIDWPGVIYDHDQ